MKIKASKTSRGFSRLDFTDLYGTECSLQQSSLAECRTPGASAVWLGCNDADPKVMVSGKGWQPVPLPEGTVCNTRMHLDPTMVKQLIKRLQKWVDTGKF